MSLPSSANQPTQKPGMNVYTVMLIIAFCALVVACALLAAELEEEKCAGDGERAEGQDQHDGVHAGAWLLRSDRLIS